MDPDQKKRAQEEPKNLEGSRYPSIKNNLNPCKTGNKEFYKKRRG